MMKNRSNKRILWNIQYIFEKNIEIYIYINYKKMAENILWERGIYERVVCERAVGISYVRLGVSEAAPEVNANLAASFVRRNLGSCLTVGIHNSAKTVCSQLYEGRWHKLNSFFHENTLNLQYVLVQNNSLEPAYLEKKVPNGTKL